MNDTNNSILKIKVEGETTGIPVESFLELLGQTISILRDLDANISETENGNLDWEIVEASLNSPLALSVAPRSEFGVNNGVEVINAYIHGFKDLDKGESDLPEYFTPQTLQKAKSLSKVFTQGITRISFSTNNSDEFISTTKTTFENVELVLDGNSAENESSRTVEFTLSQVARVEEQATLVGKLEVVSVHGKQPHFVIYDPLTKKKIDCFFDEKDFEEIQAMLSLEPYRVEVTGRARYDKNGNPLSIQVEHYRKLRNQNELPQFKDLAEIDLTGDLNPTEYIRRLRSEQ